MPPSETLTLPTTVASFLQPYLPTEPKDSSLPFVTLTYATSLDSHLSLAPGVQTALSGLLSKSLTHYLRSKHAAILIGVSTAVADDPGLNCRLEGVGLEGQPRPIILDPNFRWKFTPDSRVLRTARAGKGKAPYIIVSPEAIPPEDDERVNWIHEAGGKILSLPKTEGRWGWDGILMLLDRNGLGSVMVEGGGGVINDLLSRDIGLVHSVVVTVAPVYLGQGGVNVSPPRSLRDSAAVRFRDVEWSILGGDVVMSARPDLS
ncbi:2,5-diamino-6-(ribosylamino)-4(3H)-pyrimidinone 5'-phosphate reductase [Rhizina undulata]